MSEDTTGRPILVGAVLGVLVVAAAVAMFLFGGFRDTGREGDRVLLVVATPASDQAVVAGIVAVVDISGDVPSITPVDPSIRASIPGTGIGRVGDAYSFGGASAVAQAYMHATSASDTLPYLHLSEDAWMQLVEAAGGMRLDLPEPMDVFTGERLVSLTAGEATLSAEEAGAAARGAEFLGESGRKAVVRQLSEGAADAVLDDAARLRRLIEEGSVSTDLNEKSLAALIEGDRP